MILTPSGGRPEDVSKLPLVEMGVFGRYPDSQFPIFEVRYACLGFKIGMFHHLGTVGIGNHDLSVLQALIRIPPEKGPFHEQIPVLMDFCRTRSQGLFRRKNTGEVLILHLDQGRRLLSRFGGLGGYQR